MNSSKDLKNIKRFKLLQEDLTMKRLLCLSAAIVCLTSCLVGCGSKDDSKSDSSAKTSTSDSASKDKKDKKEQNEFIGKWECKEIEMNGEKTDNFLGADAFALFQLDIQEGGKGTVTSFLLSMFSEDVTPFDIKWEKAGDDAIRIEVIEPEETETTTSESGVTFESETSVLLLKKDGSDYILASEDEEEDDGSKIYLVKVDEFTPIPEDMEMSLDFSTGGSVDFDGEVNFGETDIETTTTQKAE